jgi:hypothetical protein
MEPSVTIIGARLLMPRDIVMAVLCAAILGSVSAPANAADLGLVPGSRANRVHVTRTDWTWRERCAYAGYYCLYAEYGYVYAYPFDDRPIAHSHYRRVRTARR